jgi:hypothetical protein
VSIDTFIDEMMLLYRILPGVPISNVSSERTSNRSGIPSFGLLSKLSQNQPSTEVDLNILFHTITKHTRNLQETSCSLATIMQDFQHEEWPVLPSNVGLPPSNPTEHELSNTEDKHIASNTITTKRRVCSSRLL